MPKKLNGRIVLSKIPKELIFTGKDNNKSIYIDIIPNKNGVDQYGNTHAVTLYNKETRETIYLGNLKPVEFGAPSNVQAPAPAPAPASQPAEGEDDLPFTHRPG